MNQLFVTFLEEFVEKQYGDPENEELFVCFKNEILNYTNFLSLLMRYFCASALRNSLPEP
jgi:hypothetical protein